MTGCRSRNQTQYFVLVDISLFYHFWCFFLLCKKTKQYYRDLLAIFKTVIFQQGHCPFNAFLWNPWREVLNLIIHKVNYLKLSILTICGCRLRRNCLTTDEGNLCCDKSSAQAMNFLYLAEFFERFSALKVKPEMGFCRFIFKSWMVYLWKRKRIL